MSSTSQQKPKSKRLTQMEENLSSAVFIMGYSAYEISHKFVPEFVDVKMRKGAVDAAIEEFKKAELASPKIPDTHLAEIQNLVNKRIMEFKAAMQEFKNWLADQTEQVVVE